MNTGTNERIFEQDAKGIRQSVSPKLIAEFSKKGLCPFLFSLIFDWAIIIGILVTVHSLGHWLGYVVGAIIIATRQQALGVLGHEAVHRTIHRNNKLNDFIGNFFCLWPLGVTVEGYREFHIRHHARQGRAGDPEAVLFEHDEYKFPASRWRFVRLFFTDLLGLGAHHLAKRAYLIRAKSIRDNIGLVLFWTLLGGTLIYFNLHWLLVYWFAIFFTATWAFFRIRELTEHTGFDGEGTHRIEPTPLQRFFFYPHNIGLHFEHHYWPSVPFHKLRSFRARINDPEVPVASVASVFKNFETFNTSKS